MDGGLGFDLMGGSRVYFAFHAVESSTYEVYQQKGIMENISLYELAGETMPDSEQRFIVRDAREEP